MANTINVGEADFEAVFMAAHAAKDSGDDDLAESLDKIARKINASLSGNAVRYPGGRHTPTTWRDVPSVFDK